MTKRKAAKIISKYDGVAGIVCMGVDCLDCPLNPCVAKYRGNEERKKAAELWLNDRRIFGRKK